MAELRGSTPAHSRTARPSTFVILAVLLGALVVACTPPSTAADSAPIHGGDLDRGHPAVGFVMLQGRSFCTGALITHDVVLTAAHCIEHSVRGFYTGSGEPLAVSAAPVGVPLPPPPGMIAHPAVKKAAHPGWRSDGVCPSDHAPDVGLIRLAAPVTGIAPMSLSRESPPASGTTCEAVGFGAHLEADGSSTIRAKRTGTVVVRSQSPFGISVGAGSATTDRGDSGGPLICDGFILGADSCWTSSTRKMIPRAGRSSSSAGVASPQGRVAHYGRVDKASAWIAATIARWNATPVDARLATDGSMQRALGPEHDESSM